MDLKEIIEGNKAVFSHASEGILFYKIETPEYTYQFSINMNRKEDVGQTVFFDECEAITLDRYIRKGIKTGGLIKMMK